jgi:hypothetical protein
VRYTYCLGCGCAKSKWFDRPFGARCGREVWEERRRLLVPIGGTVGMEYEEDSWRKRPPARLGEAHEALMWKLDAEERGQQRGAGLVRALYAHRARMAAQRNK